MSVGIGRGRGRLPQSDVVEPLRRPSNITLGRGSALNKALDVSPQLNISSLSLKGNPEAALGYNLEAALSDPRMTTVTLFRALDKAISQSQSQDNIQNMIKVIFNKVISSPVNPDIVSKCIYLATKHETMGHIILTVFFNELQKTFEERANIKEKYGKSSFWRFAHFFSSVCHYTRNIKQPPISEVVDGILSLIQSACNSVSSEDIKILVICVVRHCHYANELNKKESEKGPTMLRQLLASKASTLSPTAISWLTLGLEASIVVPAQLPPHVNDYYIKVIGSEVSAISLKHTPVDLPSESRPRFNFSDVSYQLNFV